MSESPEIIQHRMPRSAMRPRPDAPTKRAVIYLRVSTAKQADTDERRRGLLHPAQREACPRKAADLGAEVVEEYIDRGETAKTTDRPEFQRMLARIRRRPGRRLRHRPQGRPARPQPRRRRQHRCSSSTSYGAQLVSVTENIDETPAGQLLHAIMAGIAEFYSRNLGHRSLKGMTQKAKTAARPAGRRRVPQHPASASTAGRSAPSSSTPSGHRSSVGVRALRHRRVDASEP